jgi:hypothetical protein
MVAIDEEGKGECGEIDRPEGAENPPLFPAVHQLRPRAESDPFEVVGN